MEFFMSLSRISIAFVLFFSACEANDNLVINITNVNYREITSFGFHPVSKKEIYFVTQKSRFYTYNLETKKSHLLSGISKSGLEIDSVSWSANGSYIAFLYKNDIYLYDVKGEAVKQLTVDQEIEAPVSWNGEEELFFTSIENNRGSIKKVNIETGLVSLIYESKGHEHYLVQKFIPETKELFFSYTNFDSSPEGVDVIRKSNISKPTAFETINLQTDLVRRELGSYIDISSDGRLMLFDGEDVYSEMASISLYVANTITGEVKKLLQDENDNLAAKFSNDNESIIFLSRLKGVNDVFDLRIMELE